MTNENQYNAKNFEAVYFKEASFAPDWNATFFIVLYFYLRWYDKKEKAEAQQCCSGCLVLVNFLRK